MVSTAKGKSHDGEKSRRYTLNLDGAYYSEALDRFGAVKKLEPAYDRWVSEIEKKQHEISAREAKYADPADAYDEVESLCIQLNGDWDSLQPIALSYIQNAASVHILCFACLEAHINVRAEEKLQGKAFNEFDKLTTTGKWLFFPKIVGAGEFEAGLQPFQSLQRLATRRNSLVHYKTRVDYRQYGFEVPNFVDELELRVPGLQNSLDAVKGMVVRLAEMEKRGLPGWLTNEYWDVFGLDLPSG